MAKENHIEVTWEIEDGYCGGARPQSSDLSFEDFEEDMSYEEITDRVWELVEEDFKQSISFDIDNLDDLVHKIQEHLEEREDDPS
jgi:hypothetical protein